MAGLDRRVTLITGAAAGIGPATAELFANQGARVIVVKSLGVQVAGQGVKVNGIAPDLTISRQSDFERFDP